MTGGFWRKMLAFAGPGYLVAVGYMDPGNWATDLAGGSRYGYTLLSVIMLSNLMAILLQALRAAPRDRQRPRSRPGLPRSLLAPDHDRAVAAVRGRDRRVRSGRSDRLGHCAQPAVRPAADLGRVPDVARRAARALLQQYRFRYVEALVVLLILGIAGCFASSCGSPSRICRACIGGFVPQHRDRRAILTCSTSRSASSARR